VAKNYSCNRVNVSEKKFWSGHRVKIAVFWVVAPCSLVEVYQRFRGPFCLRHQGCTVLLPRRQLYTDQFTHRPDDGGSKDLWNVGKFLPDYMVLQPRRQQSSYSPPWEPQILLDIECLPTLFTNNVQKHHSRTMFVQFCSQTLFALVCTRLQSSIVLISKCFWRWCSITAIYYLDFIHRPYVFCDHSISIDSSSLVHRKRLAQSTGPNRVGSPDDEGRTIPRNVVITKTFGRWIKSKNRSQ
jgi:hypothetical protein